MEFRSDLAFDGPANAFAGFINGCGPPSAYDGIRHSGDAGHFAHLVDPYDINALGHCGEGGSG